MTATLEITRKKSFVASLRKMSVLIDGKAAAELSNGQSTTLPVPAGPHTIEVMMGSLGSAPARLEFAGGQAMQFGCYPKMGAFSGSVILARTDGSVVEGTGPRRHQAKLVLVFGLLGLVIGIFGLAALGQGISNLREMSAGKMDPSGRSMTLAGTIVGGIGFALNVIGLLSMM
jgi:hypothetical protein